MYIGPGNADMLKTDVKYEAKVQPTSKSLFDLPVCKIYATSMHCVQVRLKPLM